MGYHPEIHHRRSIRLEGYDYTSAGAYFVTICTLHKEDVFGDVREGRMHLNGFGEAVQKEWLRSFTIRSEIRLDEFVVMPNHFHAIVWILEGRMSRGTSFALEAGASGRAPLAPTHGFAPRSLGSLVAGFKSATTKRANEIWGSQGPLWQRNYYEHIIRDEDDLDRVRKYILDNPAKWAEDAENPKVQARTVGRAPLAPPTSVAPRHS